MNNFFQRLMSRQQGQADTVQPRLPSRFGESVRAAATEPLGWAEPSHEASSAFEETPSPSLPISLEKSAPVSPAAPPWVASEPSHETTPERIETVVRWMGKTPTASADRRPLAAPANLTESQATSQSEPPLGGQPPWRVNVSSELVSEEASLSQEPLKLASAQLDLPSSSDSERLSSSDIAFETVSETSLPPTELPSAPTVAKCEQSSALPNSLQPALQAPPLPTLPTPTVQVSIGRVEIRATTPAVARPTPRPRRVHAVRTPSLSLDHYLQRRSQGG